MKIISEHGNDELARVYVARMRENGNKNMGEGISPSNDDRYLVEFAESIQPPVPRKEKWVLIISSLFGCPVKCGMCDAGGGYYGKLDASEILEQIDFLIRTRFPDGHVPIPKFKIQFARMGEPALNPEVLKALRKMPGHIDAPGLMPCVSTVAPAGTMNFFEELLAIKNELYPNGKFQLQFSIHTTDDRMRDELMPIKKMSLEDISTFGQTWFRPGDRKITLNFAMADGYPVDPARMATIFSADIFLIKLTPINPTRRARVNELVSVIDGEEEDPGLQNRVKELISEFESLGFEVLLSIGELEENQIGSNCGMYISH